MFIATGGRAKTLQEISAPDHDCSIFATTDYETGEQICIKCGMVIQEPDNRDIYVPDLEARRMNAEDHYSGNDLLNSQTENMDYISRSNMGLAYKLNKGSKDFQGKKVKTTLNFAYQAGNIAGGKAMVLREDPLTGESVLKFDGYDKPMLRMVKERAMSELSRYGLSTVEMTIIAKECKKIVSTLFFSQMLEYAWRAAAINSGVLKEKDSNLLEQQMYALMEPIRIKLLSRCDSELAKELTPPEPIKAK